MVYLLKRLETLSILKQACTKNAALFVFGFYHNRGIISIGINIVVKLSVFDNVYPCSHLTSFYSFSVCYRLLTVVYKSVPELSLSFATTTLSWIPGDKI